MLATKNFGKKSLNEIKEILHGMGLDFGMDFDEQGNPIPGTGGSRRRPQRVRRRRRGRGVRTVNGEPSTVTRRRPALTRHGLRFTIRICHATLKSTRKLGRTSEHRMSMLRNLATSLINARDERIVTTVPKAKELRPFVERVITLRAKRAGTLEGDDAAAQALHLRRQAAGFFHAGNRRRSEDAARGRKQAEIPRTAGVAALKRLFDELGERYAERAGRLHAHHQAGTPRRRQRRAGDHRAGRQPARARGRRLEEGQAGRRQEEVGEGRRQGGDLFGRVDQEEGDGGRPPLQENRIHRGRAGDGVVKADGPGRVASSRRKQYRRPRGGEKSLRGPQDGEAPHARLARQASEGLFSCAGALEALPGDSGGIR